MKEEKEGEKKTGNEKGKENNSCEKEKKGKGRIMMGKREERNTKRRRKKKKGEKIGKGNRK